MDDSAVTLTTNTLQFVEAVSKWIGGLPPTIDREPFVAATGALRTAALKLQQSTKLADQAKAGHVPFHVVQMAAELGRLEECWRQVNALAEQTRARVMQATERLTAELADVHSQRGVATLLRLKAGLAEAQALRDAGMALCKFPQYSTASGDVAAGHG